MTKGQAEPSHVEQPKTYTTIEAPITYEIVQQRDSERQAGYHSRAYSKPTRHPIVATQPLPHPHTDELRIPRPEHPHPSSRLIPPPPHVTTKISIIDSHSQKSQPSHASSSYYPKTAPRQSDFAPILEVRSAKDVPLPPDSRVAMSLAAEEEREKDGGKADKSSVGPKESVSQISGTKKGSGRSRRSRFRSSTL